MALDQYFEEAISHSDFNGEHKPFLEKWQSDSTSITTSDDNRSSGFDCNICLDSVQDPVVTLCGHLFCWPCIYKWLHFQTTSAQNQDQQQLQCPVCKSGVSQATLVPLYGRGQTTPQAKASNFGTVIPRRPSGPPRTVTNHPTQQLHHQSYPQAESAQPYYHHLESYTTSSIASHPVIGMFGEMVYGRVFGDSVANLYTYPNAYQLAGSSSPRLRRHIMQADKSLSRICFFLFCCVVLCLLLF